MSEHGLQCFKQIWYFKKFSYIKKNKEEKEKKLYYEEQIPFFIAIFVNILPCCFRFTSEEELIHKAFLCIFFFSTLQVELTKPMSNDLLCNP